jgi:hypothetical protein
MLITEKQSVDDLLRRYKFLTGSGGEHKAELDEIREILFDPLTELYKESEARTAALWSALNDATGDGQNRRVGGHWALTDEQKKHANEALDEYHEHAKRLIQIEARALNVVIVRQLVLKQDASPRDFDAAINGLDDALT